MKHIPIDKYLMSEKIDSPDEDYESIFDNSLPQIEFEKLTPSEFTKSKLSSITDIINEKFNIQNYQIAGGLAIAIGYFEYYEFNIHSWDKIVDQKYFDIDIYVEPADFRKIVSLQRPYLELKPNLATFFLPECKRNIQFICKQKFSIQEIVSSFDFNITSFFINIVDGKCEDLYKDCNLIGFEKLIVKRVVQNSKQSTLDRIAKYIKRYNVINSVEFDNSELFISALRKHNKINGIPYINNVFPKKTILKKYDIDDIIPY